MRAPLVTAALALALPGCFPGPDVGRYCQRDSDCEGQCARGGRCIDQGSGIELRVSWTIAGAPASAEACAGIDALDIRFSGDGDEIGYYPTPCELGQAYYDVLPPWLERVEVVAVDDTGAPVARASRELSGAAEIQVDLQP